MYILLVYTKKYTIPLYLKLKQLIFKNMGEMLKTAVVVLVVLAVYDLFIKKMLVKNA